MQVDDIKLPKESKVIDKFNLIALTDCGKFLLDKEGHITAVLKLNSNFSDDLDDDRYTQLFNVRKQAFELIGENYHFAINSIRKQKTHKEESNIADKTIKELTNIWNSQFIESYQTTHYITLTTKNPSILAKTVAKQQQVDINKLESIENKVSELLSRLQIYNLELLTKNDLISYYSSLLNAREVSVATNNYLFDEFICDTDIFFPEKKNYLVHTHNDKKIYSCFLSIKAYPTDTTNRLFKEIQKLNTEFNIYQYYYNESRSTSISKIDERIRRLERVSRFNETALIELSALNERLQNDEIKLLTQVWNIQVFASSIDELNKKALEIQTLTEHRNLLLMRETKNLEACFWAIFPTWEHLRVRKYQITSDNLSHFITFASDNEGLTKNSWGDSQVCKFKTTDNSVYNFSFHETSENLALGNTVVIGGSGLGKTTLISFLISQAMRYDNFKCMAFDRGYGLKIFADVIGASYTDFTGKNQNINPLQLNEEYKSFLQSWLQGILNKNDDESIEIIANALNENYNLKKADRNLSNIAPSFGKAGKDSIRNALKVWLPDGANGSYFNGKKDALDFDTSFTFFDTTILLDNPEILGAMADYLFFRIKTTILNNPSPYAIFVDELNKYLASEQFAPKLKESAAEIRKTNGVLIMAVQSAATIFENTTFQEMKDNISTYILFPNHKADAKYYIDEIGLNSAEFNWIKTAGGREVMIKKTNAETVTLNIDLSILGKYLKVFNSSSKDVREVNKLQASSSNWLEEYLNK